MISIHPIKLQVDGVNKVMLKVGIYIRAAYPCDFALLARVLHTLTQRSQDLFMLFSFSTPQGAYTTAVMVQGGDNCPHSFPFTAGWTGGSCLMMPKARLEPATHELRISNLCCVAGDLVANQMVQSSNAITCNIWSNK